MAIPVACYALLLVLLHQVAGFEGEGDDEVPTITNTFRAIGDITTTDPKIKDVIMAKFEENYSVEKQRSSFTIVTTGVEARFTEIINKNKTFMYIKAPYQTTHNCSEFKPKDWNESGLPPDLKLYELNNGHIVFPLRQLLTMDPKFLVSKVPEHGTFRQVPSFNWVYHFDSSNTNMSAGSHVYVYSSWTREGWQTTSLKEKVPLGFVVIRNSTTDSTKATMQTINIMYFLEGMTRDSELQMRTGTVCEGFPGDIPLPDISSYPALSYRMELIIPIGDQVLNSDTWVDVETRKMRIVLDLVSDAGQTKETYDILVTAMYGDGVVYTRKHRRDRQVSCTVTSLKDFDIYDPQMLLDVRSLDYSAAAILDVFNAKYVHLGQRYDRALPTLIYQGVRTTWPPGAQDAMSLWELDIAMGENLRLPMDYLPLLSAHATLLKEVKNSKFGPIPQGMKLIYNFYDVRVRRPGELEVSSFDISSCLNDSQQKRLQFEASIPQDVTEEQLGNWVTDLEFLASWKYTITQSCKMDHSSLRVSHVHAILGGNKRLFIHFTLLEKHPDLPEKLKRSEDALVVVYNKLKDGVDKSLIKMEVNAEEKKYMLGVVPGTLMEPFTLFKPDPEPKVDGNNSGLSGGAIAGLVIGLLVLGVLLGTGAVFLWKRLGNKEIDRMQLTP